MSKGAAGNSGPFFIVSSGGISAGMRYLIFALLLSACGSPSSDSVGGVTRSEAEALNDAAEMLDANAVVPVVVENGVDRR